MRKFLWLIPLALASIFCSLPGQAPAQPTAPAPDLQAIIESTLTASAAQTDTAPTTGNVRGRLGYPADTIPPLRIIAYPVDSDTYFVIETAPGQTSYDMTLPPGTYNLVAYTLGGGSFPPGLAGGYTAAVPCGMAAECANHNLLDVVVQAGQPVENIHLIDWLQPNFPPLPAEFLGPEPVAPAENPAHGSISGTLMYPASFIPPLRVVAFPVAGGAPNFIDTNGESVFEIKLPAGQYYLVAYALPGGEIAGGYTAAVPCGLTVECSNHTLLPILVSAGQTTPNITPGDFYAPAGTFPPMP